MRLRLIEADDDRIDFDGATPEVKDDSPIDLNKDFWDTTPRTATERVRMFEDQYKKKYKKDFKNTDGNSVDDYILKVFPDWAAKSKIGFEYTLKSKIKENGIKTSGNKFLPFAAMIYDKGWGTKLDDQKASFIATQLQEGKLDIKKKWLTDERAYNGSGYKIQALLTLSDVDTIKLYMDPKEANKVIEKVLDLKDDKEIATTLDSNQTRHGEDRYRWSSGSSHKSSSSGKETTSKAKLIKLAMAIGMDEATAKKNVDAIYNPKESEASLVHKLTLMRAKDQNIDLNAPETTSSTVNDADLIDALKAQGFKTKEATTAIAQAKAAGATTEEDILKQAIKSLGS